MPGVSPTENFRDPPSPREEKGGNIYSQNWDLLCGGSHSRQQRLVASPHRHAITDKSPGRFLASRKSCGIFCADSGEISSATPFSCQKVGVINTHLFCFLQEALQLSFLASFENRAFPWRENPCFFSSQPTTKKIAFSPSFFFYSAAPASFSSCAGWSNDFIRHKLCANQKAPKKILCFFFFKKIYH